MVVVDERKLIIGIYMYSILVFGVSRLVSSYHLFYPDHFFFYFLIRLHHNRPLRLSLSSSSSSLYYYFSGHLRILSHHNASLYIYSGHFFPLPNFADSLSLTASFLNPTHHSLRPSIHLFLTIRHHLYHHHYHYTSRLIPKYHSPLTPSPHSPYHTNTTYCTTITHSSHHSPKPSSHSPPFHHHTHTHTLPLTTPSPHSKTFLPLLFSSEQQPLSGETEGRQAAVEGRGERGH